MKKQISCKKYFKPMEAGIKEMSNYKQLLTSSSKQLTKRCNGRTTRLPQHMQPTLLWKYYKISPTQHANAYINEIYHRVLTITDCHWRVIYKKQIPNYPLFTRTTIDDEIRLYANQSTFNSKSQMSNKHFFSFICRNQNS